MFKLIKLSVFFATFWLIAACGSSDASYNDKSAEAEVADYQTFGDTISDEGAVSLAQVVAKLESQDSLEVKIKATVENVCQTKGCWMNLVGDDKSGEPIFVQFKDYGFFMPKDCAGQEVIVEGIAYRATTSVDELRHYAEDEGLSKEEIEKITEPEEEYKFMASGVILYNRENS